MSFQFPSLKLKRTKDDRVSLLLKNLPSFNWSKLTDKEEIGRGSFGSVFVARYPANDHDERVVIKKLLGTEEGDRRLFLKEASILHRLRSKNVVKFKGICSTPCAIMLEYLSFDFTPFGGNDRVHSLEDFLHYIHAHDAVDAFPFHDKIVEDICSGMAYLHEQEICHRDLKPANILVSNKHYAGLDNQEDLRSVCMSEPIVCKVTDFGESRSQAVQTATICHTATHNVQRGSPAYLAPEVFSGNLLRSAVTIADMKAVDIWALGMVFFILINPDFKYPFETELNLASAGSSRVSWREVIENKFQKKEKPRHGQKYEIKQATDWFMISEAFEQCTSFTPSERPSVREIEELFSATETDKPIVRDIPLKVSQTSAVSNFDRSALVAGVALKEPAVIPNDATNGCAFLCLQIANLLLQDGDCSAKEDEWKDTASLVEDVIVNSPKHFNRLRDVSKFYDVMEAYQLLRQGGCISSYNISEEMITQQPVYSQFGRSALTNAVKSLCTDDRKTRIGLYTCGGYIVLIGCKYGKLFVIDTHPIHEDRGGNGNGLLKVFPFSDVKSLHENTLRLCSWMWKRLRMSGVGNKQLQSFSVLELVSR